jgi:putative FmdB family regulatory protein
MPIYEYGCDGCGHQFEVSQKLAEAPLRTCPACGKDLLQKLISSTAFVLKGGGWYKDGYGSKGGDKEKPRTENQRADRLQKAIDDDKKKTTETTPSGSASTSESSSAPASGSTPGGDKSSAVSA